MEFGGQQAPPSQSHPALLFPSSQYESVAQSGCSHPLVGPWVVGPWVVGPWVLGWAVVIVVLKEAEKPFPTMLVSE